jgi:hypothetical protein
MPPCEVSRTIESMPFLKKKIKTKLSASVSIGHGVIQK